MALDSKPIAKTDDSSKEFIKKCLKGDITHGFDIDGIQIIGDENSQYYIFEYLKCECDYRTPHNSDPKYYPYNWKKFHSLYQIAKTLKAELFLVNYSDRKQDEHLVRVMVVDYLDYDALKEYNNLPTNLRPKQLEYIHLKNDLKITFEEYSDFLRKLNSKSPKINFDKLISNSIKHKSSPILYMGNKQRLINKGLTKLFPENIETFYDLFAGSGVVSMNTTANRFYINDIDPVLQQYYKLFTNTAETEIIDHIEKRVKEYDLPTKTTIRIYSPEDEVEKYKKNYTKFRDMYNKNPNVLDLYTLMFFAFSQQFRINKQGQFNMPFGNNCFSETNKKNIKYGCSFFQQMNIELNNQSFDTVFNNQNMTTDDFVYLDPPYINTVATYNENGGWTKEQDDLLLNYCKELNNKGIKFGLSNVFINKKVVNKTLIEFCLKNNLYVYTPKNFIYHTNGKNYNETIEVFITNYEISQDVLKKTEFFKLNPEYCKKTLLTK